MISAPLMNHVLFGKRNIPTMLAFSQSIVAQLVVMLAVTSSIRVLMVNQQNLTLKLKRLLMKSKRSMKM